MSLTGKYSLSASLNFIRNFQVKAIQTGNVTSQQDRTAAMKEKTKLTPQDIGKFSRKISIKDNNQKKILDRFVDMFA